MKEKWKKLMAEYGRIALAIYFVLLVLTYVGFMVAISAGFEIEAASGTAGLVVAAWVASKVTQPLRIAATLVLTPLVAKVLRRKARSE